MNGYYDVGFPSNKTLIGIIVLIGVLYVSSFDTAEAGFTPTPPSITPGDTIVSLEGAAGLNQGLVLINHLTGVEELLCEISDLPIDMKLDSKNNLIILTESSLMKLDPTTCIEEEIVHVDDFVLLSTPSAMDMDSAGNIFVLDDDGEGNGLIIKIDPISGTPTLIVSDISITGSTDIITESSGDILVLNWISIYRVDPVSGTITLLSSNVLGGENLLVSNDAGDIYAAGTEVVSIDPVTGVATSLSSGFYSITGMDVSSDGKIVVVDVNDNSIVYKIDPNSGIFYKISNDALSETSFGSSLITMSQVDFDADDDGIIDELDLQPTLFSDDFGDTHMGGTTEGVIVDYGGQDITITDESYPDGVRVTASMDGDDNPAIVEFCDGASAFKLVAGDEVVVTCGSVISTAIAGPIQITFISTNDETAETTIPQGNKLKFDPETFTFTASSNNIHTIIILKDGKDITIPPGSVISIQDVDTLVEEPPVDVLVEEPPVDVLVEEPPVDVLVEETTPVLDENTMKAKQEKEEAEKEAIKKLKKKQKEKADKKSELTSQRDELKKIRTEMKMMKHSENSEELNEKLKGLISQIQTTLDILKAEFDYEKEYKNELVLELKEQKESSFNTKTISEKNLRHKIGSKLYLLSQSNDPSNVAKDLGLKYKNGQTTISLYFSKNNPDVLEQLNSIGEVNAASGNMIQVTLNLKDLNDLKSIPDLEQITQVVSATRSIVYQDD